MEAIKLALELALRIVGDKLDAMSVNASVHESEYKKLMKISKAIETVLEIVELSK